MFGYGKIFQQIFDSSIADDWQVRHVFEDLIILSNSDGVVDMTHDAIARRTNTPVEIVTRAISELEKPDPKSRSKTENGARLKRLDKHREWGWWIVNHEKYRNISSDEQYRKSTRKRVERFRKKKHLSQTPDNKPLTNPTVTLRNVSVTHVTPSRSSKQKAEAEAIKTPEGVGESYMKRQGNFPDSLAVALDECCLMAVPKEHIEQCFEKANSRGGLDARGLEIRNFKSYVSSEWKYEQERQHKQKMLHPNGQSKDSIMLQDIKKAAIRAKEL